MFKRRSPPRHDGIVGKAKDNDAKDVIKHSAGWWTVFDQEIVASEEVQPILSLLKQKGAPIVGAIILNIHPDFEVFTIRDFLKMGTIFCFEKKARATVAGRHPSNPKE